jgi:hypothetical protein
MPIPTRHPAVAVHFRRFYGHGARISFLQLDAIGLKCLHYSRRLHGKRRISRRETTAMTTHSSTPFRTTRRQ